MKRFILVPGAIILGFLLFFACAPRATVSQQCMVEQLAAEQRLVESWDEFDIYLYEWTFRVPAALLFDPNNDEKTLRVGKGWSKIATKQSLVDALDRRKVWQEYANPNLCAITGPDGAVWGHAITILGTVSATLVDDRTIDISPPREPKRPVR